MVSKCGPETFSKLKMCSGDRRNVLRRFSPSLKLPQKSPDIRTTISQNMHQYKGGWEQGGGVTPPPYGQPDRKKTRFVF